MKLLAGILFPYVLLIYLLLFLLESMLPGFVSDTVDLNFVLVPVLVLGCISALSDGKHIRQNPVGRHGYFIMGILSLAGFIPLFLKTRPMGPEGLWVSLGTSVLVFGISWLVLSGFDREEDVLQDYSSIPVVIPKRIGWFDRKHMIAVSVIALVSLVICIVRYYQTSRTKPVAHVPVRQSSKPEVTTVLSAPPEEVLENTPVTVTDATGEGTTGAKIAAFLKSYKLSVAGSYIATDSSITVPLISFSPEQAAVAEYITTILSVYYPTIEKAPPMDDSDGIEVIVTKIK